MARSVVLKSTPRCARCQLAPRWCICAGLREIESPLRVDVLMHYLETLRPSSTGDLLKRVIPASGQHIYRKERLPTRADIAQPGKELWILHPNGEPMPKNPSAADLQVLLLDGNWQQAGEMSRAIGTWGRRVSLPMTGESRYWLRAQSEPGRFSTMEALLFLLSALGLQDTHDQLRGQFELHVYAGLRSRGHKDKATAYLESSPIRETLWGLLGDLAPRNP
jgi:DTW domain-containing protein